MMSKAAIAHASIGGATSSIFYSHRWYFCSNRVDVAVSNPEFSEQVSNVIMKSIRLVPLLGLIISPLLWAAEKPNIVLLFADDLGRYASAYADPGTPSPRL